MDKSLEEIFDEILEDKKIHRFEGESGVKNLAKICRILGYQDFQSYGQFLHDGTYGAYGDIFAFLEDNPGCIEAMVEWMKDHLDCYEEHLNPDGDEDEEASER